jgi:hypothetical protein
MATRHHNQKSSTSGGSKSARGTRVAAIIYSLVESAKVCGIDPIAYLTEIATRAKESPGTVLLPDDFSVQAAAAWTAAQPRFSTAVTTCRGGHTQEQQNFEKILSDRALRSSVAVPPPAFRWGDLVLPRTGGRVHRAPASPSPTGNGPHPKFTIMKPM